VEFAFAFDRGQSVKARESLKGLVCKNSNNTPKRQFAINIGRFGRLNSGKPYYDACTHPGTRVPWQFSQKREAMRFRWVTS
jgi:hypothetical protein